MATNSDSADEVEEVEFTTYEKMPCDTNGWVSKKLDSIKQWVALEKVHGANLSFTAQRTDSTINVKVARRNAFLKEGESFFSIHQQKGFLDGLIGKVKELFEEVCKLTKRPVTAVTVYGELFGGSYPHPSVTSVPKLRPVQREIVYCPGLHFIAFDIAVTNPRTAPSEVDDDLDRDYLDYDVCMQLFKSCGMLFAEPLLTGTLQAMLDYPLGFESTIPARLGLPPLPEDMKNQAEGIVVKPIKNIVLETSKGDLQRVIFKRKIEGFRETKPREKKAQPRGKEEYNPDYELVKCEVFAMVTPQRLVNVISKIGLPDSETDTPKEVRGRWQRIKEGLVSDVLEDMAIENEVLWKDFKRKHAAMVGRVKSELRKECETVVKDYREQNAC